MTGQYWIGDEPKRSRGHRVEKDSAQKVLTRAAQRIAPLVPGYADPESLLRAADPIGCGTFGCAFAIQPAAASDADCIKLTTDPAEAATTWWLTTGLRERTGETPHENLVRVRFVGRLGRMWPGRHGGAAETFIVVRELLEPVDAHVPKADDKKVDRLLKALASEAGHPRERMPAAKARHLLEQTADTPWHGLVTLAAWMLDHGVKYVDWKHNNVGVRVGPLSEPLAPVLHDLGYSESPASWRDTPRVNPFVGGVSLTDVLAAIPEV